MEMQVNNTKKMGRPMITDPDYNSARARKMEADADLAELELLQAKKELVSANDVLNSWVEVLAAMRAKMLSLPTVTAPLVANETDIGAIQHIIEKQIHEALDELSTYDTNKPKGSRASIKANDKVSNVSSETTTKTNSNRMGRPRKTAKFRS
jgi:phage terminase Nu1 subunit (DNA packaging protein)